jgi:hypothetical protein
MKQRIGARRAALTLLVSSAGQDLIEHTLLQIDCFHLESELSSLLRKALNLSMRQKTFPQLPTSRCLYQQKPFVEWVTLQTNKV